MNGDGPERVLITGAARGIGAACARRLAWTDARIVLIDRDVAGLEATARELHPLVARVERVTVDLTDVEATSSVGAVLDRLGGLDAAVNAAGIAGPAKRLHEISREEWDAVIAANLTSMFELLRLEVAAMRADGGGAIVNISSILGGRALAGAGAYTAAKHGVEGLTRAAALDYAGEGIRVNAVAPGFVDTEMLRAARTPDERAGMARRQPMGRLAAVEEVAETVAFLVSPSATFVTGASVPVDGGYLAGRVGFEP